MNTANTGELDATTARAEFIKAHGLTMTAEFVPQSRSRYAITARADKGPGEGGYCGKGEPCINWRVTLAGRNGKPIYSTDYAHGTRHLPEHIRHPGNRRSLANYAAEVAACESGRAVPFGTFGTGERLSAPTIEEVLYCLGMDSSADDLTFEEWCGDYGYDTDSRKAESIYRQCADVGRALRLALGAEALDKLRDLFSDY